MSDICSVFQVLQKNLQKVCIVLPDVIKHRDTAVRKLTAMLDLPYVGGAAEEKWVKENGPLDDEPAVELSRRAKKSTQFG